MKIKNGYVLKEVAGTNVVVNVGKNIDFNGMITLNETAALLWRTLEEGADSTKLTEAIISEYEVDLATAEKDVAMFINKLEGNGILE